MVRFSDAYIRNLKPTEKTRDIRQGHGFGIRVFPSGEKTFFFRYTFEGKKRYMNLGRYPDKSLADARREHAEASKILERGIDPVQAKEEDAAQRRQMPTVQELYEEYMKRHAIPNKKERTWKEDKRLFEKDILPVWGKRKADSITRRDVTLLIDKILDRGAPIQANNTFERVRQVFNFAVERGTLEHSPCFKMKAPTPRTPRDRHLTEEEIKTVWGTLDGAGMTAAMRRALKLILVTGQRPGEVAGLHRNEINGEWWTIPAERSKNGKPHMVYLTATALELIGNKEGYIFPSPRKEIPAEETQPPREKPIDENALARAIRNNCPTGCRQDCGACSNDSCLEDARPMEEKNRLKVNFFRPHDLRRTAATHMAAAGFTDEVIDAVLNHVKKGVIRTYNLHRYDREKQMALETWERKLRSLISGKEQGNVVPLVRAIV